MIPLRKSLVTAILVTGILWLPLPAGSVTPAGEFVMRLFGLAAVAMALLIERPRLRLRPLWIPFGATLALAAFALLQSFEWPAPLVQVVSPEHLRLKSQALAAMGSSFDAVPATVAFSLAPAASRSVALTLVCLAGGFLAAATVGRRRRRWLAVAVVIGCAVQLFLGTRDWAAGVATRLRGTFVNPDHLATLLEIGLVMALIWGVWAYQRKPGRISVEQRILRLSPPLLAWLLLFIGLAFTGSRAGLVAGLLGLGVQVALLLYIGRSPRSRVSTAVLGVGASVVALTVVGAIGFQQGFGRLLTTSGHEFAFNERWQVWVASLELVERFLWLGSGLGTFVEAFPLVQPASLTDTWARVHNDYLELLVTGGVLGLTIGLVGLMALIRVLWQGLQNGRATEDRLAALGGLGVVASVGFHELLDFGATLPGTAFVVAVILGSAAGASLRSNRPAEKHVLAKVPDPQS